MRRVSPGIVMAALSLCGCGFFGPIPPFQPHGFATSATVAEQTLQVGDATQLSESQKDQLRHFLVRVPASETEIVLLASSEAASAVPAVVEAIGARRVSVVPMSPEVERGHIIVAARSAMIVPERCYAAAHPILNQEVGLGCATDHNLVQMLERREDLIDPREDDGPFAAPVSAAAARYLELDLNARPRRPLARDLTLMERGSRSKAQTAPEDGGGPATEAGEPPASGPGAN